jgi:MSHA biogenesis protein MshJ
MQIIEALKLRLARFDGMSLRERALIVAAAVAVVYFVLDLLVIGPNEARSKALRQGIEKQKVELETSRKMMSVFSGALEHDPNAKQQAQLDAIKRTIVEVDALLAEFDSAAPQAAGAILREVLGATPGLELVSLKTLPVAVAFETKAAPVVAANPAAGVAVAAPKPEPTPRPPRSIYRHAIEISVRGNYLALLPYLEKLQKYPGRIYWSDVSLEVETYPLWIMKLTVYTLSPQPNPRLG